MKIRAIGTGSFFCRHPLVTSSFLIQSETSNVVIGCGTNIPAKLETINLHMDQIDMWIPLNAGPDQIGGLWEAAHSQREKKPYLVAPGALLHRIEELLPDSSILKTSFDLKASTKISFSEEHLSETIQFEKNYGRQPSYSLIFEEAEIFISGTTEVNDEFLHRCGMPAQIILHNCSDLEALQQLPVYLQKKVWIYGYKNALLEQEDPLPMLFLPQGTCLFDSDRKEKHLDKERFIRENAKRLIGNLT
jgi:hypothetical protein